MSRKIVLKKCDEHEHCQLKSINDGPWTHTPEDSIIGDRFPDWPPTREETKRGMPDSELVGRLEALEQTVAELTRLIPQDLHQWATERYSRLISRVESLESVMYLSETTALAAQLASRADARKTRGN